MNLTQLESYVESIGEKRFRGRQLFEWMYAKGAQSFDEMTSLSRQLRDELQARASISTLTLDTARKSEKDGSIKYLFRLDDGQAIESVLMEDAGRTTLCVSTQVGCAIDCKFCATGAMGLKRNLTAGEIVDQLLLVQRLSGQTISNVVCMGMGEPFHNYDNLMQACALWSDKNGPNLSRRHVVVSTSGLIPRIYQFADEQHKYKLAISVNATTDEVRNHLMPLNKRWPLRDLFKAARYYTRAVRQPVTFEYVLLDGVNDTVADAERLKELLRGIWCKVNLIPYNPTLAAYRLPTRANVVRFYERLADLRAPVTIRWSKGDDIEAGCGQLAVKA